MYKILLSEDSVKLYKKDEEVVSKTGEEDLYVETYVNDVKTQLSYDLDLSDDFKAFIYSIIKTQVPFTIYFRPYGKSLDPIKAFTNILKVVVEDTRKKPSSFTFRTTFQLEGVKESYGVSDYRYVYDYMPKWSTAYKFPYSTHTKTVEPLFTNLFFIREGIQRKLRGYNAGEGYRKTKDLKPYGVESYITLSDLDHSYLQEYLYLNDSRKVLDFGDMFTSIYITAIGYLDPFELIIEGEYNGAFITEKVLMSSEGNVLLKNKFNKIFNIVLDPFSSLPSDLDYLSFKVSNYIPMEYFAYEDRENTFLSLVYDVIVQIDKKTQKPFNTFKFALNDFSSIYIDKDDHIYSIKDNTLYTGKLDVKLNIPTPLDPSYNNTKFIEECKITDTTSSLELFIPAFMEHSKQSEVAVKIISSDRKVPMYLTDNFDIVVSETPIYLDASIIRSGKSLTLDFKMDSEWTIIRLEDRKNIYSVSHLMVMPMVEMIKLYKLEDAVRELEALDVDFDTKSEREVDYVTFLFIEGVPHLKIKFLNETLFSYMLIPLDVLEDYKKHSHNNIVKTYHSNIDEIYEGED